MAVISLISRRPARLLERLQTPWNARFAILGEITSPQSSSIFRKLLK